MPKHSPNFHSPGWSWPSSGRLLRPTWSSPWSRVADGAARWLRLQPQHAKLTPTKIRRAIRRRYFEYLLERWPVTGAGRPEDLGTRYGGYIMPTAVVQPGWVCYSVGAGGDISLDLDLMRRFDVTVRSFEPVAEFVDAGRAAAGDDGRFTAWQVAVGVADGTLRMQASHHPGSRSVSPAKLYDSHEFFDVPSRSITSLMAEHDDTHVDLLKLDVEGGEYDVLADLDLRSLGIKVLAVQIHHNRTLREARRLIRHVESQGYEAVGVRPAVKITFLRTAID
jgi:FkbM family methyltransferase